METVFLVGLIPFRVIEWTIFIWLFFDRKFYDNLRAMRFVGLGIAWSFVLDFVALFFSLIAFGGRIWIC
jgi:hypothetical protein